MIIFFDIDYTLFNTDTFKKSGLTRYESYPEVKEALSTLSKKARLGIFSEGELNFQKEKLNKLGIGKYFEVDSVFIFENKQGHIAGIFDSMDDKTYVVDDKKEVLNLIHEINKAVKTIWMKRGVYAEHSKSDYVPDYEVKDLSGVLSIVQ